MASIDLPRSAPAFSFRGMLASVAESFGRMDTSAPSEDRPRQDFVFDMLQDNPDAFCSEADIQCMMSVYPGRF